MNAFNEISDHLRDGRYLLFSANGPLVRITALQVAPFEEEDDTETLVGDFDRKQLIRKLESLAVSTNTTPYSTRATRTTSTPARTKPRGGVGARWLTRWWRT